MPGSALGKCALGRYGNRREFLLWPTISDTSVNGLPRFKAEWQPTGGDSLISDVLDQACAAGTELLASR